MCDVSTKPVRDSLPHVSTWWPQILAAITTGVTNADSEGINSERAVSQAKPSRVPPNRIRRYIKDSYKDAMFQV